VGALGAGPQRQDDGPVDALVVETLQECLDGDGWPAEGKGSAQVSDVRVAVNDHGDSLQPGERLTARSRPATLVAVEAPARPAGRAPRLYR